MKRNLLSSHLELKSFLIQDKRFGSLRIFLKDLCKTSIQKEKKEKKRSDWFWSKERRFSE